MHDEPADDKLLVERSTADVIVASSDVSQVPDTFQRRTRSYSTSPRSARPARGPGFLAPTRSCRPFWARRYDGEPKVRRLSSLSILRNFGGLYAAAPYLLRFAAAHPASGNPSNASRLSPSARCLHFSVSRCRQSRDACRQPSFPRGRRGTLPRSDGWVLICTATDDQWVRCNLIAEPGLATALGFTTNPNG